MQNEKEKDVTRSASFQSYVQMSVDAGVPPLELRFIPIVDCGNGLPIAYRTETLIHSIIIGEMPQKDYLYVSDRRECGTELLLHSLQHAITALKAFADAGRKVQFVSVHCPAGIFENHDLYRMISKVLEKNPTVDPSQLCLEFPSYVMGRDAEKAHTALLDMKLLKVRTSIIGAGAPEFPVTKLLDVTPDMVILDPTVTQYAGSRDKPQLLSSLVSYVKSMYIDAIAEGTEENRKAMRGTECIGFIYKDSETLSIDEAVAQKEEENG